MSKRSAVEVRVFTRAHVSMIIYRVDVYRSRPIGASLLTASPQQGCLALKGLHTGWLGVVTAHGCPLNTDLDWGLFSVILITVEILCSRSNCTHYNVVSNLVVGSRPSDHYFRSVCWFVCLSVCLFVCLYSFSQPCLIRFRSN